jgi:hypothetical protein
MTSHYRHRRISNAAIPFPTLIEPGEIAVNTANRQLAVGDANISSSGAQIPLLAVRYFDVRSQYAANDFVVQADGLYRAKVSLLPAAFDASQWDRFITDVAAKAYADAGDAAIVADYQAADAQLTAAVNGKIEKSGDTMQGYLTLVGTPNQDLHAATKLYVDQQVAAGGIVTLPAANIHFTPEAGGSLSSTNVQDAIVELGDEKAPLYSPDLQGVPTTATPPAADNTTKIANTSWVQNYTANYVVSYVGSYFTSQASAAQPLMDGAVSVGTSTKFAREDHRHPTDTSKAPINSPAFTGNPTAPTPSQSSNNTSIATTAFLGAKFALYAPLADPVFTGNPQAPTPAPGDNDTSIATTEFVNGAVATAVAGTIAVPVEYVLASRAVTIPPGAHSLDVTLQGGGGCSAGGGGATLFKFLTGLTPGKTLSLTIGAGGVNSGGTGTAGGATVLQSGTQAITTLVAGGGDTGAWKGSSQGTGAGGVASNGDINLPGQHAAHFGDSMFGRGGTSDSDSGTYAPPTGYGGGGPNGPTYASQSGTPGCAILRWYA